MTDPSSSTHASVAARLTARLKQRLLSTPLLRAEIARRVDLAVRSLDDARDLIVSGQARLERDRYDGDRQEALREALAAWRANPLARRVVALTTQYVVGAGIALAARHPATNSFLQAWWQHRLNRMAIRCGEWCDELTRAGNLIVLVSTDAAGMSYMRGLPASQVQAIISRPNDVEQAETIVEKAAWGEHDERRWPVYDAATDRRSDDGSFPTVALHYAINRPVGAVWGESDLAPLLKWLSRYAAWLEDRARLNRFRQSFVYVVTGAFASRAERLARQAELNANPPNPGAILVKDETETWDVLAPRLESHEAGEDGLALKKMIAIGAGVPPHFLAEPESATRTTAEAAGGPTFRHFEQRQTFFLWLLADLARVVLARRALVDPGIDAEAEVEVRGADISARDNAELAHATGLIAQAFAQLHDRGLIDDRELLRMVYRFAAEPCDVSEVLRAGRAEHTAAPELEAAWDV